MTEGHADIHGRVLDHLLDGVMVVERGGAITVFNPAAARILGVSSGEAAGSTFTELFIAREGFEELSEFILDAVAGAGAGRRQVVALHAAMRRERSRWRPPTSGRAGTAPARRWR